MVVVALVASTAASIVVSTRADAVPVPWRNCGTPSDPIVVQQFDTSVWPPQRGQPITVNLRFLAAHDISVGQDQVTLSPPTPKRLERLFAPLLVRHFTAGPHASSTTFWVPLRIPAGTVFSVHFGVFDRAGVQDFCLDMTVPVK